MKTEDQNTEDNQNIEYSIKSASSSINSDIFSIDGLSEEISLERSLDHKRGQFVTVTTIDPDIPEQDKIRNFTISENKNQVSSIEKSSRILDLVNLHNCDTIQ